MGRDRRTVQRKEKTKKKITPQSAKAKGRVLQQWTCEQISKLTGYEWGQDKPIESRPMGQSGLDVRMESQVRAAFPFSVECKWQESWSVPAWIKQAKQNQVEGTDWLLVIKRSRENPVVVLDAELFFRLLTKYELIERKKKRE